MLSVDRRTFCHQAHGLVLDTIGLNEGNKLEFAGT